jgi:hypothetical protein
MDHFDPVAVPIPGNPVFQSFCRPFFGYHNPLPFPPPGNPFQTSDGSLTLPQSETKAGRKVMGFMVLCF